VIIPRSIYEQLNSKDLEKEIDSEILHQSKNYPNDKIVVDVSTLPSFYFDGWVELRSEYQKYWTLDERIISKPAILSYINCLVVAFTPIISGELWFEQVDNPVVDKIPTSHNGIVVKLRKIKPF
jgi:hypothetical protein